MSRRTIRVSRTRPADWPEPWAEGEEEREYWCPGWGTLVVTSAGRSYWKPAS